MSEIKKIPVRSEIPVEDTWATEDLYVSDEAWEAELATVAEDQTYAASFAGKLGGSADDLYNYLNHGEKAHSKISLLANYCMRKADEDTRNSTYQAMVGKFYSVMVALSAATSFDTPEIMAISDETHEKFYAEKPELERYRRYLTNMRRRKDHILSPAEEKLLAAAARMRWLQLATWQSMHLVLQMSARSILLTRPRRSRICPLLCGSRLAWTSGIRFATTRPMRL